MLPRILEYEEGRIIVTAEAFSISSVKAILDKHNLNAEPYLMYIHLMSAPDSPYINLPEDELKEQVIYEITQTFGDFDIDEPLLEPAVEKLKSLYETPIVGIVKEMEQELLRFRKHLQNTPLTDENMRDRMSLMKDIEKVATAYGKVKQQADKELEVHLRGDHEMGEY